MRRRLLVAALVALPLWSACPPRGRSGSPSQISLLDPALVATGRAPMASERARGAFALGQLGVAWDPLPVEVQGAADLELVERLHRERDPSVRVEIVAALGRVGREHGRRALLAELETPGEARLRAGWALAHLYRRLRDKIDPSPDATLLARALVAPEAEVRAAVTDALAEMKRPAARSILLRELADVDPVARARAARGLIGLSTPDDLPALERALVDDDERVASAAALAMAELAEKGSAPALVAQSFDRAMSVLERPAVILALSERGLLQAQLAPLFMKLRDRLESAHKPKLVCMAALTHDRMVARLDLVPSCGQPTIDDETHLELAARALSETDPVRAKNAVNVLLAMPTEPPRLRALVTTALGRYDEARAKTRVLAALDDADAAVRAAAAEAVSLRGWSEAGPALLSHLPSTNSLRPDEIDPLLSLLTAIQTLKLDGGAAVRRLLDGTPAAVALAARDVLATRGQPAVVHPAVPHGAHDELVLPDGPAVVRLETARGPIRIEVRPELAPRNARNFIGLVRGGFYDGLGFHRVVPGFVAQGGDPRGDGSGGASHLVACEPNSTPYVEGTVGMALSGPDTGSSQFFIALAPAPHLEGRYTAFGRVVEGMSVARALMPGDVIKSARLEAAP